MANKIPMNFDFHAAMGNCHNSVVKTTGGTCGFDPTDPSYHPGDWNMKNSPSQKNKSDMEFNNSLVWQIDLLVTDIIEKHDKEKYSESSIDAILSSIKSEFKKLHDKYDQYIDKNSVQLLYNACLRQYTNEWIMHLYGKSPSETEYTVDPSTHEIFLNPFLIYNLFTHQEVERQIFG